MLMKNLTLPNLAIYSALGFIFATVLPHAIALKYVFTGLMLIALVAQVAKRQLVLPQTSFLTLSFFALLVIAALSALFSPLSADALNNLRKDTLPFVLAFLLLACRATDQQSLQRTRVLAVWALILGFTIKEMLAVRDGIANNFVFSIYETANIQLPKYLDFFATDTILYLPFLLSVLLFWPIKLWQRVLLFIVTATALTIVAMSGVRATFMAAALVLAAFLFVRFWSKKWLLLVAAIVLAVFAYAFKDHVTNPSIARYYTLFSKGTYQFGNDGSVSERKAIIKAVWDISRERWWIGYGPGWKKLPVISQERGYMQRWQASTDPVDEWAYRYFSYGEGRVNPHNLYMQILFEVGVPGLLVYAALVLSLMFTGFKHWIRGVSVMVRSMGVATVLYVGAYAITGMAGGVWLPISLLILMLWALDAKNTPHSPR